MCAAPAFFILRLQQTGVSEKVSVPQVASAVAQFFLESLVAGQARSAVPMVLTAVLRTNLLIVEKCRMLAILIVWLALPPQLDHGRDFSTLLVIADVHRVIMNVRLFEVAGEHSAQVSVELILNMLRRLKEVFMFSLTPDYGFRLHIKFTKSDLLDPERTSVHLPGAPVSLSGPSSL